MLDGARASSGGRATSSRLPSTCLVSPRPRRGIAIVASASQDDGSRSSSVSRRDIMVSTGAVGALYANAARGIVSIDWAEASQGSGLAPDVERRLRDSTVRFTLSNGLTVIVRQRRNAPVFSALTYADVGSFDEENITGVAHMLEHLAFKGSPRQSVDFVKESQILEDMDDIFEELKECRDAGRKKRLGDRLKVLQMDAQDLAQSNAYGSLLQREGAVGLNAATSHDATKYYVSLPATKLELFFALEAERFQAPVFRDFYSERMVVLEERKMRVDSSPMGAFQEKYAAASFGNNYARPVIGYQEDIERLSRRDVKDFFTRYYGPEALTIAIVGDVDASKVRQYAEKYFGGWKKSGNGAMVTVDEPLLAVPKDTTLPGFLSGSSVAGPVLLRSFYRPSFKSMVDSIALDIADECLTGGRNSRLEKALVDSSKALTVSSYSTFPGEKHATQMLFYAVPTAQSDLQELDSIILGELDSMNAKGPTAAELRRFSKGSQAMSLRVLQSNASMASALASYEKLTGSWENMYKELYMIDSMSPTQIADICSKYLIPSSSFAGYVQKGII